jgi:hypothetical protein
LSPLPSIIQFQMACTFTGKKARITTTERNETVDSLFGTE